MFCYATGEIFFKDLNCFFLLLVFNVEVAQPNLDLCNMFCIFAGEIFFKEKRGVRTETRRQPRKYTMWSSNRASRVGNGKLERGPIPKESTRGRTVQEAMRAMERNMYVYKKKLNS